MQFSMPRIEQVSSQTKPFKDKINQNLQCFVNLNWRFSNINSKEKETQHSNFQTNQGFQPLHLKAKQGPYDLGFTPLNVSENQMVPMWNTQFFHKSFRANMSTIRVLPLRMNLFQNLKCQTGNKFLLCKLSEKNEQQKCLLHRKVTRR